jgi:hypothetical protein
VNLDFDRQDPMTTGHGFGDAAIRYPGLDSNSAWPDVVAGTRAENDGSSAAGARAQVNVEVSHFLGQAHIDPRPGVKHSRECLTRWSVDFAQDDRCRGARARRSRWAERES